MSLVGDQCLSRRNRPTDLAVYMRDRHITITDLTADQAIIEGNSKNQRRAVSSIYRGGWTAINRLIIREELTVMTQNRLPPLSGQTMREIMTHRVI